MLRSWVVSPNGRKEVSEIVFMHLRRIHDDLYYFRNNRACDFVVFQNRKCLWLIQVCESLNPDRVSHEVEGLREAMDFFSLNEGYIITSDLKDEIGTPDRPIHVIPAYEFLV